jgi:hypothetical protein
MEEEDEYSTNEDSIITSASLSATASFSLRSTNNTNKAGLEEHVQRQLIQDIINHGKSWNVESCIIMCFLLLLLLLLLTSSSHVHLGGIEIVRTCKVISARTSLYGTSSEREKRKRIRNRIAYWKGKGRNAFLEVAKAHGLGSLYSPPPPTSLLEQNNSTPLNSSSRRHHLVEVESTPRQDRSVTPRNLEATKILFVSPTIMSTTQYAGKFCYVLLCYVIAFFLSLPNTFIFKIDCRSCFS